MKDSIAFRKATDADARGIARVLVDGWHSTYAHILSAEFLASLTYDQHEAGTRQLLQQLPMSSAVFVADDNGSIVGVALVHEAKGQGNEFSAELDAIYVLPPMQRRQIGSRLLRHVIRWLSDRGQRSMLLWVLRDNPHRRFYDHLGGELLSEQKQNDFGGEVVTSVSYGWRDLDALEDRLRAQSDQGSA